VNQRSVIRNEVQAIIRFDKVEGDHQSDVLAWIDSGADLCRVAKPATPSKHLVSYFVLIDDGHYLLVHHRNAQMWLPTGGHVEEGEHPRDTVFREAKEELGINAELLHDSPILITCTQTQGLTAGHTDVSLWYTVRGDRTQDPTWDEGEFLDVNWFERNSIPFGLSDPHLGRFVDKLERIT